MTLWDKIFIGFNGLAMLFYVISESQTPLIFHGFLLIAQILISRK